MIKEVPVKNYINDRRRLKIVMISGSMPPMICGVGDYTFMLLNALSKIQSLEISAITSVAANGCDANFSVVPLMKDWSFKSIFRLFNYIKNKKPDLVHIQYPTLGYDNYWAPYFMPMMIKILGIPVVQTWHEPPTRYRFFPNALIKDYIIGVEPNFVKEVRYRYRYLVSRKRKQYIPIGSNIKRCTLTSKERAKLRKNFWGGNFRLIVNFGFAYPSKNIEQIFAVADPEKDRIVLIMSLDPENDPYHKKLDLIIKSSEWAGKVIVTGSLPQEKVGETLAICDVAVYPFLEGVRSRNGSFLAATTQEVFTVTTSLTKDGYDADNNVYHVPLANEDKLKTAINFLPKYSTRKLNSDSKWDSIAKRHMGVYAEILCQNT